MFSVDAPLTVNAPPLLNPLFGTNVENAPWQSYVPCVVCVLFCSKTTKTSEVLSSCTSQDALWRSSFGPLLGPPREHTHPSMMRQGCCSLSSLRRCGHAVHNSSFSLFANSSVTVVESVSSRADRACFPRAPFPTSRKPSRKACCFSPPRGLQRERGSRNRVRHLSTISTTPRRLFDPGCLPTAFEDYASIISCQV